MFLERSRLILANVNRKEMCQKDFRNHEIMRRDVELGTSLLPANTGCPAEFLHTPDTGLCHYHQYRPALQPWICGFLYQAWKKPTSFLLGVPASPFKVLDFCIHPVDCVSIKCPQPCNQEVWEIGSLSLSYSMMRKKDFYL